MSLEREAFNDLPASVLSQLRRIILSFRSGVQDADASALLEELRTIAEAVHIEPSDVPEAEVMIRFLRSFSLSLGDGSSMVFTAPGPDMAPTVEYLRRDTLGRWRLWYPGAPWEDDEMRVGG